MTPDDFIALTPGKRVRHARSGVIWQVRRAPGHVGDTCTCVNTSGRTRMISPKDFHDFEPWYPETVSQAGSQPGSQPGSQTPS